MSLICPACNKANQTDAACQRCGCDLTPLHAIVRSAASCLDSAAAAFTERDWPEALAFAAQSWELRHSSESAQTAFLAAAAAGQTSDALMWRTRALRAK